MLYTVHLHVSPLIRLSLTRCQSIFLSLDLLVPLSYYLLLLALNHSYNN